MSSPEVLKSYHVLRRGGKDFLRRHVCRDAKYLESVTLGKAGKLRAVGLPSTGSPVTRLVPAEAGNGGEYQVTCGPTGDGNAYERLVKAERVATRPPTKCKYGE